MTRSLRSRLLLTTGLVALLSLVAAVSLLAGGFHHQLVELGGAQMRERHLQLTQRLQAYWNEHGSWDRVRPLLAQIEELTTARVAIAVQDRIVAVSSGPVPPARLHRVNTDLVVHDAGGRTVGGLVFLGPTSLPHQSAQHAFVRWTWLLLLALSAAAITALFLVTRSVTRPLEDLTATVRAIDAGNLERRAQIASDDEIGVLADAFDRLMDRLAAQERSRREMTADVAHELRTPLHSLRGQLESALDGLEPLDARLARSLLETVQHMSRLVGDIEQLATGEAGQLRLQQEEIELGELVEQARASCAVLAEQAGVEIAIARCDAARVLLDPGRMLQAVRNLLENAIRHSPAGARVAVTAVAGETVRIEIADEGPGVDLGERERIFDRFHRVDRSRSRRTGGAGLGLAIVRQIAELHGGTVVVECPPDGGAIFRIELPGDRAVAPTDDVARSG